MHSACAVLYCHLYPVRIYNIFPHYLINATISGKKVIEHKMCDLIFSTNFFFETFIIVRIIQRYITINVHRSACKVPLILDRSYIKLYFPPPPRFFQKNTQIPNFIKIRQLGAELLQPDRQTDKTNIIFVFFLAILPSRLKPFLSICDCHCSDQCEPACATPVPLSYFTPVISSYPKPV